MKLRCTHKCVINGHSYYQDDVIEISQPVYELNKARYDSSMKILEGDKPTTTKENPLTERKHIMEKLKQLNVPFKANAKNEELAALLAEALKPQGTPEGGSKEGDPK